MSVAVEVGHPRYESLRIRDLLVESVAAGLTSQHGLIAHGRGEALDYLLGERTHEFARLAIRSAVAMLLLARRPVISVNGNAAALVPGELVELSELVGAALEVNLFHSGSERERKISEHLIAHGARDVLLPDGETSVGGIASGRRFVNARGIGSSDVVFVPLEDGDRCAALRSIGKSVITVDLNPLSRTARASTIAVVDNVVRALPLLVSDSRVLSGWDLDGLRRAVAVYDHARVLGDAERVLRTSVGQT